MDMVMQCGQSTVMEMWPPAEGPREDSGLF